MSLGQRNRAIFVETAVVLGGKTALAWPGPPIIGKSKLIALKTADCSRNGVSTARVLQRACAAGTVGSGSQTRTGYPAGSVPRVS